jgi:hypothetical protein
LDGQLISFAVFRFGILVLPKAKFGLPLLRNVFRLGYLALPKAKFGLPLLRNVFRLGYLALPKAFQANASHSLVFFAFRLFTKASFRHILKTKNPSLA